MNSDSAYYGGSDMGNGGRNLIAEQQEWMNRPWSLEITLPPLAGIVLKLAPPEVIEEVAEDEEPD